MISMPLLIIRIVLLPVIILLMAYLFITICYRYMLSIAYIIMPDKNYVSCDSYLKYCIIIPAHNEEVFIARVIKSIIENDYPKEFYEIYVIADNCEDHTTDIAQKAGAIVLERRNLEMRGKGYALQWGLEQIDLQRYDAICIFDADNVLGKNVLHEMHCLLTNGYQVVQCENAVFNTEDSWFTEIQAISRSLENKFWHQAKFKLGLAPSLKGNGMVFLIDVLREHPWRAFSISEDVEYYAQLVDHNINIGFSSKAIVYHEESTSLTQAYGQRLRWSSGKFEVTRKFGTKLLWKGIKYLSWKKIDAGLFFILPHTSLQFNLHVVLIVLSLCLIRSASFIKIFTMSIALMVFQIIYLCLGIAIAKPTMSSMRSLFMAPIFLIWKGYIEILGATGKSRNIWRRGYRPSDKK